MLQPQLASPILIVVTVLLLSLVPAGAAPPQYTLTDLGPDSNIRAIAPDTTMTVGARQSLATVFYPTTIPLGALPEGTLSLANGAHGQTVVGYTTLGPLGLSTHGFRWTPARGMEDLGTTGAPDLFSAAVALNAAGSIIGYADTPDRARIVAVRWVNDAITALPSLTLGHAFGSAINEAGDSVGTAITAEGQGHAVLWPVEGGIVDLHTLGWASVGLGLTADGQVIGTVSGAEPGDRGFVWVPLTGMLLLPPVAGDSQSYATAINDAGVIIGESALPDPEGARRLHQAAVRWDNGVPTDLNTLVTHGEGWVLQRATGINDAGVIVGIGTKDGQPHGWVLSPLTPEGASPARALDAETHQQAQRGTRQTLQALREAQQTESQILRGAPPLDRESQRLLKLLVQPPW